MVAESSAGGLIAASLLALLLVPLRPIYLSCPLPLGLDPGVGAASQAGREAAEKIRRAPLARHAMERAADRIAHDRIPEQRAPQSRLCG